MRLCDKVERRLLRHFNTKRDAVKPQKEVRHRIDLNTLKAALDKLGLSSGDSVLVHSGISNLGKVIGGPRLVFDLIQEMVGSHGNVLYPVFPFGGLMYEHLCSNPAFDAKTSASKMGALSEYALNVPGGQRSIHPTHSVLAFGEQRHLFVGEHHLCETPFADKSPFARLVDISGKILLIGVGLNSTTSFHRVEDRMGIEFPVRVYLDEIFSIQCVDTEGREHQVKTLAHDPFVSRVRDGNLYRNILLEKGILRELTVGNGIIAIIDARALDECLEDLCRNKHFTVYGKIWG
jgi:aminoglycoside 3-N-acetyltransferase